MLERHLLDNLRAHLYQADVPAEGVVFPEDLAFAFQAIKFFDADGTEEVRDSQILPAELLQIVFTDRIEHHLGHRLVLQKSRLALEVAEHRGKQVAAHPETLGDLVAFGIPEVIACKTALDQKNLVGQPVGSDNDFALGILYPTEFRKEQFEILLLYLIVFQKQVSYLFSNRLNLV